MFPFLRVANNLLWRTWLFLAVALLLPGVASAQDDFVFGVMPYQSARVVAEHHRPVAQFLREDLQLQARLETAPSFRAFYDNTVRGDYDMVVIAAHFARLLQLEHGFVPLVRYGTGAEFSIIVRRDSEIQRVEQLKGKLVATPDRMAFATIVSLEALNKLGVRVDQDYQMRDMATFNSAALAVDRGDADAAVGASAALLQMPPGQREKFRTLHDTANVPALIYMAHPRMAAPTRDKLRLGLLRYSGEPRGRAFFDANGFGSFVPVTAETMKGLDVYLPETRRQMMKK